MLFDGERFWPCDCTLAVTVLVAADMAGTGWALGVPLLTDPCGGAADAEDCGALPALRLCASSAVSRSHFDS